MNIRSKRQWERTNHIRRMNVFITLHKYVNYPIDRLHEVEYEVLSRHIICSIMEVTHVKCTGNADRQKRCSRCDCYFNMVEMNCPCCKLRVRTMQHAKAQSISAGLEREQHEI